MIPVMQSRMGMMGNCFSACLASLLDCALHAIPEFSNDDDVFIEQLQCFLLGRNKFYFELKPDDEMLETVFKRGMTFHIVEGRSSRGGRHACVALNGEIIHDPHPGGRGLETVEVFGFLGDRL